MADAPIVSANQPFSVNLSDGVPCMVADGDLFYADDEVVVGREHLFGQVEVRRSSPRRIAGPPASPVGGETADATPGTARQVTRPPAAKPGRRTVDTTPPTAPPVPPPSTPTAGSVDTPPAGGKSGKADA